MFKLGNCDYRKFSYIAAEAGLAIYIPEHQEVMKAMLILLVAGMFVGSLAQNQQPSPLQITAPAVCNDTTCPSTDILPPF